MYARIVWGKLRPGTWTDYERHFHNRMAHNNHIQGLRERQLIRSTEDADEGISLSIWDSMEDLLNYERGEFLQEIAKQEIAKEVEHLFLVGDQMACFLGKSTSWEDRQDEIESLKELAKSFGMM